MTVKKYASRKKSMPLTLGSNQRKTTLRNILANPAFFDESMVFDTDAAKDWITILLDEDGYARWVRGERRANDIKEIYWRDSSGRKIPV